MMKNSHIVDTFWGTENTYAFTGKERDEETGYSYFGARYYDSDLSGLFLSVDPMADKYPNISPYAYCAWNPVKLVDPDGDSIRNAYEMYKDISEDVHYLESLIRNESDNKNILNYSKQINKLKELHNNYSKIEKLLSSFKENNETEYNLLNNLSFNGNNIDVYVGLNNSLFESVTGAVGQTTFSYTEEKGRVVGIGNNVMKITIFRNGFNDGFGGVGTLANEFGDVLFGIQRPDYNNITNKMGLRYENKPTTKFSYDYEQYITSRGATLRPNPNDY